MKSVKTNHVGSDVPEMLTLRVAIVDPTKILAAGRIRTVLLRLPIAPSKSSA